MDTKIKADSKKRSNFLLNNTIIFAISIFGTKILSFFLLPLYTSHLTTTQYGQIDLTSTINSLLPFFLTLCISDAVLRFVMENRSEQKKILTFGVKIVGVGSLIVMSVVSVLWLTNVINQANRHYLFIVLLFPLECFRTLFSSFLKGTEKTKDILVESIFTTLITLVLTIIAVVVLKWGVFGYLAANVCGLLFGCIYYFIRIKITAGGLLEPGLTKELKKQMIIYSLPLILNGVSWWINSGSDRFIINMFWSEAEIGIYSVAGKIPSILTIVTSIFAQAWTLSSIKSCEDEDYGVFFSNIYNTYKAILFVGASALILMNQPLSKLLYAKDFFIANQCVPVLVLGVVFNSLAGCLSGAFSAFKNNKALATTTISSAVINIALNFLLIPKWGCIGAAIATAISFFALWISRLFFAKKYVKIKSNVLIDWISCIFIIVQVVCDFMVNKQYIIQSLIFVILIVLNFKYIENMIKIVWERVCSIFRRKNNENV